MNSLPAPLEVRECAHHCTSAPRDQTVRLLKRSSKSNQKPARHLCTAWAHSESHCTCTHVLAMCVPTTGSRRWSPPALRAVLRPTWRPSALVGHEWAHGQCLGKGASRWLGAGVDVAVERCALLCSRHLSSHLSAPANLTGCSRIGGVHHRYHRPPNIPKSQSVRSCPYPMPYTEPGNYTLTPACGEPAACSYLTVLFGMLHVCGMCIE